MGTIVIEGYSGAGSEANRGLPVHDLSTLLDTHVDASTSTSEESHALASGVRLVSVYAVEAHRVALRNETGTTYAYIPAGKSRDFGITGGTTIYYRLDA